MTPEQAARRHELFQSRRRRTNREIMAIVALFCVVILAMCGLLFMV